MTPPIKLSVLALAAWLSGCAPLVVDDQQRSLNDFAQASTGAPARWQTSEQDRATAAQQVGQLLAQPIGADDAVRIALAHSPALQALFAEAAAASARATQSARLPNPLFTFERLVRREPGGAADKEIGRMLGVSLIDLLLLPSRIELAAFAQQQIGLRSSADVLRAAASARQAWVRAVAAQQSLAYFEQVKQAAEASAELARRMQSVGNFSKLQRAREQAFYADATAQLARAQQATLAAREALVRVLGLDAGQAARLSLLPRLPELPGAPRDEAAVAQTALDSRLDVRLARANLDRLARAQGLTRVTSVVNGLHIAGVRNSETGRAPQKGYELEFTLPIFDFGDALRASAQADYMAALQRTAQVAVDAGSQVREQYGAYRTAYDLARHYRDEIVPLRKAIADENLLRYNGMLIGVFELLADAREQIGSVVQAIEAQRDFWLADAALQGALLGAAY